MTQLRLTTALLAAGTAAALLTGCGSDSSRSPGGSSGGSSGSSDGSSSAPKAAAAPSGGDVKAPCDVTDQATVASVFPGAGAGKAGQVRNCEYTISPGSATVKTINIFFFDGVKLDDYEKQDKDNQISFTPISVGDGAIKDQLHTVIVQQGDVLFGVQALGEKVSGTALAKNDPQVLALATKIAANLS